MKIVSYLLSIFCFCLFITACGAKKEASASSGKLTAALLNGEWNVVKIGKESVNPGERTPFMGFSSEEKRMFGFTGCNRMFGQFNAEDLSKGTIDFGAIGCTRMACLDDSYEQPFLNALNEVKTIKAAKNGLVELGDASGKTLIVLKKRVASDTDK